MTTPTKQQKKELAWKKYLEIQQPAWDKYLEIEEPARKKYREIQQPAWNKYQEIEQPALKRYKEEYKRIEEEEGETEIIHNGKKYRLVEE
jgi:hypothetical protein